MIRDCSCSYPSPVLSYWLIGTCMIGDCRLQLSIPSVDLLVDWRMYDKRLQSQLSIPSVDLLIDWAHVWLEIAVAAFHPQCWFTDLIGTCMIRDCSCSYPSPVLIYWLIGACMIRDCSYSYPSRVLTYWLIGTSLMWDCSNRYPSPVPICWLIGTHMIIDCICSYPSPVLI